MRKDARGRARAVAAALAIAQICLLAPLAGCGGDREIIRTTERTVARPTETTTVVERKTTVIRQPGRERRTFWYTVTSPFRWLGDLIGITVI
ncbi:MAG: hypothetical protein PHN82_11810 [bacterium]|nr:hypothetical protein [bacterium]